MTINQPDSQAHIELLATAIPKQDHSSCTCHNFSYTSSWPPGATKTRYMPTHPWTICTGNDKKLMITYQVACFHAFTDSNISKFKNLPPLERRRTRKQLLLMLHCAQTCEVQISCSYPLHSSLLPRWRRQQTRQSQGWTTVACPKVKMAFSISLSIPEPEWTGRRQKWLGRCWGRKRTRLPADPICMLHRLRCKHTFHWCCTDRDLTLRDCLQCSQTQRWQRSVQTMGVVYASRSNMKAYISYQSEQANGNN